VGCAGQTVFGMLDAAVERRPDAPAFTYCRDGESSDDEVTFAGLHARAGAVAGALREQFAPGARVLLLNEPGIGFVTGLLACAWADLVPVAAQPPGLGRRSAGVDRLAAIAADCAAAGVLCDGELSSHADDPRMQGLRWQRLEELAAAGAAAPAAPTATADDVAFLQTTSGSTASPKAVMLTQRNLVEQARVLREVTYADTDSVAATWAPLHHDLGLVSAILLPLAVGYHSVLMSPLAFVQRPARWLTMITRRRATIAGAPNFAYELLLRTVTVDQRATLDLSSWGFAFTGAEPVRARTLERFARAFAPVGFHASSWFACWGLAEGTSVATGRPRGSGARISWLDRDELRAHGSMVQRDAHDSQADAHVGCGTAFSDHEVLAVDPERRVALAPGAVGELWLRGPCVGAGYWGREDDGTFTAMLADGRGPFLRTGDLGVLDADGEVFVVGRIKDMLIVRGRNVAPQDVEDTAAAAHPDTEPGIGAAFAVDDGSEERVVVVQALRRRFAAGVEDIRAAIAADVAAEHGIAAEVVLVRPRAVPRTSSGKIRRSACRDAYLTGALDALHGASVATEAA
jgi:acyl-CoA synthetase (AMP-forming)/AMP-acid ligase II